LSGWEVTHDRKRIALSEVGEGVLTGKAVLRTIENDWDWLGKGIYFWENKASRASEWAKFARSNSKLLRTFVNEPFVVGAVIDLGKYLHLLEVEYFVAKETHETIWRTLRGRQRVLGDDLQTAI
jgi:hypothetical protein